MTSRFTDKVVLITGAGSGMGRGTALKFAAEGAKVMIADISEKEGEATRQMIADAGGQAAFVQTDVTQASSVDNMVQQTLKQFGALDVAFNNAGVCTPETYLLHETSEEQFDREMAINQKGVFLCMKSQLPVMMEAGGGAIVNTISVLGLLSAPGSSSYVASKHGAYALTKTAALEYARYGIRINGVNPGAIDTPMLASSSHPKEHILKTIPLQRFGQPEDIAEAVLWLASDAASYITGQCVSVDGGLHPR